MNQPDFTKLFFDCFGDKPRKVQYQLRRPPQTRHDLVFLSSLIHDARFGMRDVTRKGRILSIRINRDCWEIPMVEHAVPPASCELHIAKSRLELTRVKRISWRMPRKQRGTTDRELLILDLHLDENWFCSGGSCFDFVILGDVWKCVIDLGRDEWSVCLHDEEAPRLWSKRNAQRKRAIRRRQPVRRKKLRS